MFRMVKTALNYIEYFFIGDLRHLFTNKLKYVQDLAAHAPADTSVITRRIGLPLPGCYQNVSVVMVSSSYASIIDKTSRKETLIQIDKMLPSKDEQIFFSRNNAKPEHNAFKTDIIKPNLHKIHAETVVIATDIFEKWYQKGEEDIRKIISNICLGVTGKLLLGLEKIPDDIHEIFSSCMRSAATHAFDLPILSRQENQLYEQNKRAMQLLLKQLMKDNRATIKNNPNYISQLIHQKMEKEHKEFDEVFLDQDILAQGPSTLLAAENIASLIMLLMVKLQENDHVRTKMKEEIDKINVVNDILPEKKLLYTTAVFLESLRFFSLTSLISRYNPQTQKIGEIMLPFGYVFIPVSRLHKINWENSNQFQPERFLDAVQKREGYFYQPHNFFMPFSAGARLCPGQSFAFKLFLSLMYCAFKHYDFKAKTQQEIIITDDTGSTKLRTPFLMTIQPLKPAQKNELQSEDKYRI